MAEPKTKLTDASVSAFLDTIDDAQKREDCKSIVKMMQSATGAKPVMWGANIVGFGQRLIKYADGSERPWPIIGFSPRKQNITLYLGGFDRHADLMKRLGKHSTGKGCLYIRRLSDVDTNVLKLLVREVAQAKQSE
jgi:hypothetical protein